MLFAQSRWTTEPAPKFRKAWGRRSRKENLACSIVHLLHRSVISDPNQAGDDPQVRKFSTGIGKSPKWVAAALVHLNPAQGRMQHETEQHPKKALEHIDKRTSRA